MENMKKMVFVFLVLVLGAQLIFLFGFFASEYYLKGESSYDISSSTEENFLSYYVGSNDRLVGLGWKDSNKMNYMKMVPVSDVYLFDKKEDSRKMTIVTGKLLVRFSGEVWIYGFTNKKDFQGKYRLMRVKDSLNFLKGKRLGFLEPVSVTAMNLKENNLVYQLVSIDKARRFFLVGNYQADSGLTGIKLEGKDKEEEGIGLLRDGGTRYYHVAKE